MMKNNVYHVRSIFFDGKCCVGFDQLTFPSKVMIPKRLLNVMERALTVIKETGRGEDFITMMTAMSEGTLDPGFHVFEK